MHGALWAESGWMCGPGSRTLQVLLVVSSLTEECTFLTNAASAFYAPLALFGHLPGREEEEMFDVRPVVSSTVECYCRDWPCTDSQAGELEEMMGRSLSLFRNIVNYTERVNAVVLNIVQQLACMFDRRAPTAGWYAGVNFMPLYKGLGSVLTTLVTLDAVSRPIL
jgi:hypothetical protein